MAKNLLVFAIKWDLLLCVNNAILAQMASRCVIYAVARHAALVKMVKLFISVLPAATRHTISAGL